MMNILNALHNEIATTAKQVAEWGGTSNEHYNCNGAYGDGASLGAGLSKITSIMK
jgi:hypothetical protein